MIYLLSQLGFVPCWEGLNPGRKKSKTFDGWSLTTGGFVFYRDGLKFKPIRYFPVQTWVRFAMRGLFRVISSPALKRVAQALYK
jgi:hypothetical protein